MQIKPLFKQTIENHLASLANQQIYEAIQTELAKQETDYTDLIIIHKDQAQRIVLLQADVKAINLLLAQLSLALDESLQQISESKLEIPLSELWGSYWLANRGPVLKVKWKNTGSVNVQLQDKFESVGVNQSRHKIYALFKVNLQVTFPGGSSQKEVIATVPIAESIIVGEVPEYYGVMPWGN